MLNNKGFDLIYGSVLSHWGKVVLDIGFGTGTLTSKLYENGCEISGQDFSSRMIELAYEKMLMLNYFREIFQ